MNRVFTIIILLLAVFTTLNPALCMENNFRPQGLASMPVGSQAANWQMGYSLGLDYIHPVEIGLFNWGIRTSFQRWTPNAEEMLKTGSHDLKIESSKGSASLFALSGLLHYHLVELSPEIGSLWLEGGLGVYYIRWSEVDVKGVYPFEDIALTREIHNDSDSEIIPGINLGVSMNLTQHVEPSIRYQYLFTKDEGTGILTFGIGLLAH